MAETKLSKAKQLAVLRQQQVGEVVSQEDFDKALKEADKKTTNAIIKAIREQEKPTLTVNKRAVWLWGRLKEFERSGCLEMDPDEVLSTMSGGMPDEVHVLALRVAAWLKLIGELS